MAVRVCSSALKEVLAKPLPQLATAALTEVAPFKVVAHYKEYWRYQPVGALPRINCRGLSTVIACLSARAIIKRL